MDLLTESETEEEKIIPLKKKKKHSIRKEAGTEKSWIINSFFFSRLWSVAILAGNGEPLWTTGWRNIIQDTGISDNGVQPILT